MDVPVLDPNYPFDNFLIRMKIIHDAKRTDYASKADPLGNFNEALRLGVSVTQGIAVRLSDKWSRFCNLFRRGGKAAVADENLIDTLIDMANYSILLGVKLEAEAREAKGLAEDAKDLADGFWLKSGETELAKASEGKAD